MSKVLTVGWALLLVALLTLLAIGTQSDAQYDELGWATTECEQGNTDACQLERNLLTEKE